LIDVVEFGNNTSFTKDINEFLGSVKVIEEKHDLLLPGDGFLIIVKNR
jgi:hypothetical protein